MANNNAYMNKGFDELKAWKNTVEERFTEVRKDMGKLKSGQSALNDKSDALNNKSDALNNNLEDKFEKMMRAMSMVGGTNAGASTPNPTTTSQVHPTGMINSATHPQ